MRRVSKLAALVVVGALSLAGCGDDGDDGGGTTDGSGIKVGLAYDIGGRGDQSFNDAAARGLDKAKTDLGIDSKELEASPGESDAAKEERLRLLAEGGYSPVIAIGFAYSGPVAKVAKEFPDTKFGIVDDAEAKGDNIANLVFAEEEGSFLVGAAAAMKSKSGHVGFVGGVEVPLIQKFQAGYVAGVKHVNKDAKVDVTYLTQAPDFSGFNDPARGEQAAKGMYDAGADVVYHAAGGSGGGVFTAAKAARKKGDAWAIGVDSDQYQTADPAVKDVILTSMLKKVDVAVFDFIKSVDDDNFKSGEIRYDLAKGGVDYSTSGGFVDDIKSELDDLKQQIIDGKIKVPSTL